MKVLYLDCGMGAAGDMLSAALLELHPHPDAFIAEMNALGLPGVHISAEKVQKCGITGTHVSVKIDGLEEHEYFHNRDREHAGEHEHDREHSHAHSCEHEHSHEHSHTHGHEHSHTHGHEHGEHSHRSLSDIYAVIDNLNLPESVKAKAKGVYKVIAEAEGHVHGKAVSDIHFHEVGTLDAVADITAVCQLIYELKPDSIAASPVNTGCGSVKCAHGILPVPAPAAAHILRNIPIYSDGIRGELCTPTGAALLAAFVNEFGPMPALKADKIGYGMGMKDFPKANCVRAFFGESCSYAVGEAANPYRDRICELSCNVEDMTGEEIGFAIEKLMASGAVDANAVPVTTKKSRPGFIINVLCRPEIKEDLAGEIFKHTSTLGVREKICERRILKREIKTLETPYGPIRAKISEGYGVRRFKYEYDDLAAAAEKHGLPLQELKAKLPASF
ncbi:nickel pincer cofactor biosynthesis protein LarC [bacterium]|nr:nickel pincer cofactor biosynthesis protein LarC [bacterium]